MTNDLLTLSPAIVWKHFAALTQIPRPSKHEEKVKAYLLQWAKNKGLTAIEDKGGNIIIKKAASKGFENAPGVILQGHLDMVCQKHESTQHDFLNDPIKAVVKGNLVTAENTTLGADDGIGVALALAALDDETLIHGPLEALLTVDEEEGMGGANLLDASQLSGDLLINLDSETWGDFCLGCAGGMDLPAFKRHTSTAIASGASVVSITVSGLRGGHSGMNIHENRGNAIKIMVRLLAAIRKKLSIQLCFMQGGTARNAIPREVVAIIAIDASHMHTMQSILTQTTQTIRRELRGIDDNLTVTTEKAQATQALSQEDTQAWLLALNGVFHGVWQTNPTTKTPRSSNNLATVHLTPQNGSASLMPRSTQDSSLVELSNEIVSVLTLGNIQISQENFYPGWEPDLTSPLLAKSRAVYKQTFGEEPKTHVIHAGLECGILKSKLPRLDAISFGPTINNPHAPGESVEIDTVEKSWLFLKALLARLAQQ